ncbi:MAG: threonylcarbamoyl-AMP synthase [Prevotellaceae bacterium]|jgi:L-threonylcarbamoyladenylate synthase|nr:threonylcarbamoyl-AMP synthase [Prevotellaceae bacterium]
MQDEIKKAVETVKNGGVILYPTDTVWGIGCDATNAQAVERIYKIKRRADSKALITLVDSENRLQTYVEQVPNVAWDLLDCIEEPLTIIYPKGKNLAPNLLAENGSVAIRVTKEKVSKMLCFKLQRPIVSTSANLSGEPSPQNFSQISSEIRAAVDYIVPLRQNEKKAAQPSKIIALEVDGRFKIIRD